MQVWTIEVADAAPVASAGSWRRAHGEWLVEAALTHGAQEWTWVVRPWGVLLELSFDDEADWLRSGPPGGAGRAGRGARPGQRHVGLQRPRRQQRRRSAAASTARPLQRRSAVA